MNNKGQFLLYDALLAFLIVFVVLTTVILVLNQQEDTAYESNIASDKLSLLSSIRIHDTNLLIASTNNDSTARDIVCNILSDESFVLSDLTSDKVLINKKIGNYKNVVSYKKIVGGHEFELKIFL